jgi:hypothetical protein
VEVFKRETSAQSKPARVEEWSRLSLDSGGELKTWWKEKLNVLKAQDVSAPPTGESSIPAISDERRYVEEMDGPETERQALEETEDASGDTYMPRARDFATSQVGLGSPRWRDASRSVGAESSWKSRSSAVEWDKYF